MLTEIYAVHVHVLTLSDMGGEYCWRALKGKEGKKKENGGTEREREM
jgi:hypothetical protein